MPFFLFLEYKKLLRPVPGARTLASYAIFWNRLYLVPNILTGALFQFHITVLIRELLDKCRKFVLEPQGLDELCVHRLKLQAPTVTAI